MKKILITGADGLVGSAIKTISCEYPNFLFLFANRQDADLTHEAEVEQLFSQNKPDYVIHSAARVGGIGRNLNSPALQFKSNILMNTFVIDQAHRHNVQKLLAFSSVCVFPAEAKVLREDNMHDGPPFPAHWSYAHAKRQVDVQIEAYRQQHGRNYTSIIPGNIFGENDNFNLVDGHVIPSLIHKFYNVRATKERVILWGDGSPLREFLYAKDVARTCLELLVMDKPMPQRLIVSGQELSIKDIATKMENIFDYRNVEWDSSKPNGQKERKTDTSLFKSLFPTFQHTPIDEALENTIRWFEFNYPNVRR